MKVSVVIRNRNEAEYIGFAIQSCLDHFDDPEIIIVDNNSTDDSLEVVKLFDDANIKVLTIDDYTPGRAINLGIRAATWQIVCVLSAHCKILELPKNMEENVYNKLMDGTYVAIFGQQTPRYRGKKITPRYIWSHFGDKPVENMFSTIENRQFLHNAFCFYYKAFVCAFPMPENHVGKEDRYWAIDVVKNGYNYLYTPMLQCEHYWTTAGNTWKGMG